MDYTLNKQVEIINNDILKKRKALTECLIKNQARKNDYTVVKGNRNIKTNISQGSVSNIKYVSRDLRRIAKESMNNDDIGIQSVFTAYDGSKAIAVGSKKLIAVNNKLVNESIKVSGKTINIAGKTYKVANKIYEGYKVGNINGTLNLYKNMVFKNTITKIKYTRPVYFTNNFVQGTKTIYLKTAYKIKRNVTFMKGVTSGKIKITPQTVKTFAKKEATVIAKGSWRMVNSTAKTVDKFARNKMTRGVTREFNNSLKSIGKKNEDIGMQTIATTADTIKYTYKGGEAILKGTKTSGGQVYKTTKGTYKFVKNVKQVGIKKTSRLWYHAHMRGAGKKFSDKVSDIALKFLKSTIKNPSFIAAIALFLCVTATSNAAVISATSVVGGVVEFFEELVEGLKDTLETVVEAINDFLDKCTSWIKGAWNWLTGNDDKVDINIDVDIGDNLSICDYLLGTVQIYKAEFGLKIEDRRKQLIETEGYHDVIFYNFNGDNIEIHDIYDVNKGLMADKDYVKAELPVWKSVIFGTIGTEFTGKQANNIAKECFDSLTRKIEEPYVDLNNDGVADYHYCDGSASLGEGENLCVIQIGGEWVGGLNMTETRTCYNSSSTQYHTSHNTDGIPCCVTRYWCGGHEIYSCQGHKTYCTDINNCANKTGNIIYCTNIDSCTNKTEDGILTYCNENELNSCVNKTSESTITYCFTGEKNSPGTCDNYETSGFLFWKKYKCKGHTVITEKCQGHSGYKCQGHITYVCQGHRTYCWEGYNTEKGTCSDYHTVNYKCYYDTVENSQGCSNEKSEFTCKGYNLCKGHKLMKFYLGSDGFDGLIQDQFKNRIDELEQDYNLTDEEREELSQLKMFYEYALGCWENSDPVADEWYANQP